MSYFKEVVEKNETDYNIKRLNYKNEKIRKYNNLLIQMSHDVLKSILINFWQRLIHVFDSLKHFFITSWLIIFWHVDFQVIQTNQR